MSNTYSNLLDWFIIWSFFLTVVGFMFAEAFWLSKKGWTNFGRAFVFAAVSNFISFVVGSVVFFVVLAGFMMFAFDGSLKNMPPALFLGLPVFAVFLTPMLLIICKRSLLAMLKIQTGKAAWLYALVSSILVFVVSPGVPILLAYFI